VSVPAWVSAGVCVGGWVLVCVGAGVDVGDLCVGWVCMCVCVCLCMSERERQRERQRETERET
jgi:hypothetical protein